MPELPEVETIARQLRRHLRGRRIRKVTLARTDLLPQGAAAFRRAVQNRRILRVGRRGKRLVCGLSGSSWLVVSLGMTGRLLWQGDSRTPVPLHVGVTFHLEPKGRLHYADSRRFGRLVVLGPEGWEALRRSLGPEPFDPGLSGGKFHQALSSFKAPIWAWLQNQHHLAGVGNIYANEALHRARIHPMRPAASLSAKDAEALLRALRRVLREAIQQGGSTLRDYRNTRGEPGTFVRSLQVYGRGGLPCRRCGIPLVRGVRSQRSFFFCPRCQPV